MKLLTILALTFSIISSAQQKNILTKSVNLKELISFVVDNYPKQTEELQEPRHINLLLQVGESGYNAEDRILIHQSLKLLSQRLGEEDLITITTYSQLNGIALEQANPKDIKLLFYTIDNLKQSIKEFHEDGIALAYSYMEENFTEDMQHSVVMVRNSSPSSKLVTHASFSTKKQKKGNGNAVVLTAIALLPELISVIKD